MRLSAIALAVLCTTLLQAADAPAWAVPTFESLGLYYNRPVSPTGCVPRYRVAGSTDWRAGYPLVYDQREKQYRGSLVNLAPGTSYDIRLEADGPPVEFQARTRTRRDPHRKDDVS